MLILADGRLSTHSGQSSLPIADSRQPPIASIQVTGSEDFDTASVPSRTVTESPHSYALGVRKPAAARPTTPSKSTTSP